MRGARDAGPVRVLRSLDAVRLRPAMYVGDPADGSGLHRMVELAVCDALARGPGRVAVTLRADGTVEVGDDGRPFPSPAETMLTQLMRYDPGHLALVNARLRRDGRDGGEEWLAFAHGHRVARPAGVEPRSGSLPTRVTFLASAEVFGRIAYDRALVAQQLRELGSDKPGTALVLTEP